MARENPSWGEERIANELLLKLGLRVSPRTNRKYLPNSPAAPDGKPRHDQRWSTFLKNHAAAIIACDFCVVASATFRLFYVLVIMDHASRRIIHLNVTAHPTAAWTLQQLREAIPSDHAYRFILHDHDAIFSSGFDQSLARLDLEIITTPVRSPQANALCERLIGTLRRECLDWIIPLTEDQTTATDDRASSQCFKHASSLRRQRDETNFFLGPQHTEAPQSLRLYQSNQTLLNGKHGISRRRKF